MSLILICKKCKSKTDMYTSYHWYHIDGKLFEIRATCTSCGASTIIYMSIPDTSVMVHVDKKEKEVKDEPGRLEATEDIPKPDDTGRTKADSAPIKKLVSKPAPKSSKGSRAVSGTKSPKRVSVPNKKARRKVGSTSG